MAETDWLPSKSISSSLWAHTARHFLASLRVSVPYDRILPNGISAQMKLVHHSPGQLKPPLSFPVHRLNTDPKAIGEGRVRTLEEAIHIVGNLFGAFSE